MKIKQIIFVFVFFALGFCENGFAAEKNVRVVYPKYSKFDFSGLDLAGELKNPAELYFKERDQETFKSLVKKRPHFHREMLRDSVMIR